MAYRFFYVESYHIYSFYASKISSKKMAANERIRELQGTMRFYLFFKTETVSNKASRRGSCAVMQKVDEANPQICPQCCHEMIVIAVLTVPHEVG